ncbi:MAG: AAA family ATPase [Shewanella oneidensis]|uniref:AAA family ATPase n=1 Tax=Shewanella xiamenensis TaxID=332186 RepID=UPI000DB3276C|nr:AAA family ATPase [Shewanella xiamenensis]MCT8876767.1 AAA family ATPase [Shewanella xiamenensis]PZP29170.1 MAG: AAA family ATPase [Shewanella oneidensis]
MTASKISAIYRDTGVIAYKGNPFIEALPPLRESEESAAALRSSMRYKPEDIQKPRVIRAHNICRIIEEFFQPLTAHMLLSERVSLMIRGGYVGRNPKNGNLQRHLQNGYERVQTGDLSTFRFEDAKSTAQSMLLIGCSGCGKTTSLERILQTYPQVIYHPEFNFEQVTYLKVDCSHNGSLKEICLNFFRTMDKALGSDYEKKYGLKRHGIETMLALMAQIANVHALGLLVIDEIQHLSRSKSGGSQEMLNFFVTMVNTIGVPVMLIGTPKARDIFEADLRSARRGAGLGAIFWERMSEGTPEKPNQEWVAFTDNLWRLQLLQNRDVLLTEDIRSVWYDLSQGVMDVVVKLFVLAQLRALTIGKERITANSFQQVYNDELKPVHPMLAALRSGIPEKIAQYSDLMVPEMDKRLIQLQQDIIAIKEQTAEEKALQQLATEDEKRLYLLLKDVYNSSLLLPTVRKAFSENQQLTMMQLLPIVSQWMTSHSNNTSVASELKSKDITKDKVIPIKPAEWDKLPMDDLRFIKSQCKDASEVHAALEEKGMLFDLKSLLIQTG